MTLLKQARAFGVGVVLASQNPADLDYKALANIGTWWIGRLQTERDRAKVLQAFTGDAQAERIAALLPGLGQRVFLQRNVHDSAPVVFTSRWTMSYLRGPLTPDDLRRLPMGEVSISPSGISAPISTSSTTGARPVLPADVAQWFVPARGRPATLTYDAHACGSARVHFSDVKAGIDTTRDVLLFAPFGAGAVAVDWFSATVADIGEDELEKRPESGALFTEPAVAITARSIATCAKDFADALYRTQRLELWRSPATGAVSSIGEDERAFRIRLGDQGRAARDAAIDALRVRYAPKLAMLGERLRRAQAAEGKERAQASAATFDSALSISPAEVGRSAARSANAATSIAPKTRSPRSLPSSLT